jgi:hypothetical protein
VWLKDKLGIKKVVSLDQATGDKIDRAAKMLGMKHIMMPLNGEKKLLLNFLSHDLKKMLLDDGPTYVHCREGKDRTGLVVALFKCKYMGVNPESALSEAKSLGFGRGVFAPIINQYEKLIRSCKPEQDTNSADIVSNEREYISDNRSSALDEAHQGSFSPYLSSTRQFPFDYIYNEINDQFPTRENYDKDIRKEKEDSAIPQVGQYNNGAGMFGASPVFPSGGFLSD